MNFNKLRQNAYMAQQNNSNNQNKSFENEKNDSLELNLTNNQNSNFTSKALNKITLKDVKEDFSKNISPVVNNNDKDESYLKVPKKSEEKEDSVYRRVAKFLLLIGEEEAAKILPHLSENQIEKIVPEIASIRSVSKEESEVIFAEFQGLLNQARKSGGVETAKEILEKAYGKDKAERLFQKAIPFEGNMPFEYLQDADKEKIYHLINDESIGVQSIILSNLEPKKAASVINLMNPQEKKEVVLRLAKMEPIQPDIIKRIDHSMYEKSLNYKVEKTENIDGRNVLAQILKKMDIGSESEILSTLSSEDPELGQDLKNRLFTIEDVIKSDDRFIEETLRKFEDKDICYLIAGKPDEFRGKILQNVSNIRAEEILNQEDILKPMRKVDCDNVTSYFLSILRRSYDEGHLIIKGRNDDVFI